jgi:hypothetical protein
MEMDSKRKRTSKGLLVAAIGVATVSFVSTQSGCAADTDASEDDYEGQDQAEEEAGEASSIASSQQALSGASAGAFEPTDRVLVPYPPGNLMVPEPPIRVIKFPYPPGNLMAPIDVEVLREFAGAGLIDAAQLEAVERGARK